MKELSKAQELAESNKILMVAKRNDHRASIQIQASYSGGYIFISMESGVEIMFPVKKESPPGDGNFGPAELYRDFTFWTALARFGQFSEGLKND